MRVAARGQAAAEGIPQSTRDDAPSAPPGTARSGGYGSRTSYREPEGYVAAGRASPTPPPSIPATGENPVWSAILLNGEALPADGTEGADPEDFPEAVALLAGWLAEGLVAQGLHDRLLADAAALAGLQTLAREGAGRLEINSPEELVLREITSQSDAEIRSTLAGGFDLDDGPSARQLAALNLLAAGNDARFLELLMNWTLSAHPGVDLMFDPAQAERGAAYFTRDGEALSGNGYLDWLVSHIEPDDMRKKLGFRNYGNRKTEWVLTEKHDGDRRPVPDADGPVAVTVAFEWTGADPSTARQSQIAEILGLQPGDGPNAALPRNSGRTVVWRDGRRAIAFDLDDNLVLDGGEPKKGALNGHTSGSLRAALEALHPHMLKGGSDVILYNVEGAVVDNVSDVGNLNVHDIGTSATRINIDSGDAEVVIAGSTGTSIGAGRGTVKVQARGTTDLFFRDFYEAASNATLVALLAENAGAFVETDEGDTTVVFGAGEARGVDLRGRGAAKVDIGAGARLVDGRVDFDGADGQLFAREGSRLSSTRILGGDGDDRFTLAGRSDGAALDLGAGNDVLVVKETFSGSLALEDPSAAWIWAADVKKGKVKQYDTVALEEGALTANWDLVNTPEGKALVARDAAGRVISRIDIKGQGDHLESIQTFRADGTGTVLQAIAPEVRFKHAWMGIVSSVLLAAGVVFPPAAIAGAAMKFYFDASNGQVSFRNAALTAASVAGAYGASTTVTTAIKVAATEGDVGAVAGLVASLAGLSVPLQTVVSNVVSDAAAGTLSWENGLRTALQVGADAGELSDGVVTIGRGVVDAMEHGLTIEGAVATALQAASEEDVISEKLAQGLGTVFAATQQGGDWSTVLQGVLATAPALEAELRDIATGETVAGGIAPAAAAVARLVHGIESESIGELITGLVGVVEELGLESDAA